MTNIFNDLFPSMMGEAVARGQRQAEAGDGGLEATTSPPPGAPLPQDERGGPFPAKLPESTDPAPDDLTGPATGEQVANRPTPLIGAIAFGGVVFDAATINGDPTGGEDRYVVIGDNGNGRPAVTGIMLLCFNTDALRNVYIYPDSVDGRGALNPGAIPAFPGLPFPVWYPVRRLNLRIMVSSTTTPLSVSYVVIGNDLGPNT